MEFMSVKEAARKWKLSDRAVQKYCKLGRINGAQKLGYTWLIPVDTNKPFDKRTGQRIEKLKDDRLNDSDEKRVGAVIIAAGKYGKNEGVSPFIRLGNASLIQRIVLIFQKARVSPIVVITGYNAIEVEHHLSDFGVIFIHNPNYKEADKFESAKLGLEFLMNKCDKVFFASLKIPMFMSETLREMIAVNESITIPQFEGKNGHPLLIDSRVIPSLLNYNGKEGMQGAMKESGYVKSFLQVSDEGVLLSTENISRIEEGLDEHNDKLLHPFIRVNIEKGQSFFNARCKMLLLLIKEVNTIQGACKQMALSRGKAWDMINRMEKNLGFKVVNRQQGGGKNRQTTLTEEGEAFLKFFQEYEDSVQTYAINEFSTRYAKFLNNLNSDRH